jgi:hypothetical protein
MASLSEYGSGKSLLELLKEEYSKHRNWKDKNFIPYKAARAILTEDRVRDWSKDHRFCQEHECECPEMANLIHKILKKNIFLFVVLVFARLEFLIEKLIASKSDDMMLFDTERFDRMCKSAGLNAEEKQKLVDHRSSAGVVFSDSGIQDLPRDATLPFFSRESLHRHGSSGFIFHVHIPGQHLPKYPNDTVRCFLAALCKTR